MSIEDGVIGGVLWLRFGGQVAIYLGLGILTSVSLSAKFGGVELFCALVWLDFVVEEAVNFGVAGVFSEAMVVVL